MFQNNLTTSKRGRERGFDSTYDAVLQEKFGTDIALKELAIAIGNGIVGGSIQAAAAGFDNR
jgi:hypothetical protein